MHEMYRTPKATLTESKYGHKFDQFKPPFRTDQRKVIDTNGRELAEFPNIELAKEMAAILTDMMKMREAADKFTSLWR